MIEDAGELIAYLRGAERAERTALIACDGSQRVAELTYPDLATRVERLAELLHEACGVRPGDRVGVLSPNSIHVPVALLALWRLRAAAVPLNPQSAPEDWHFTLTNAGASLVLASAALIDRVQATLPGTSPRALDALIASASGRSVESTALSELAPRAQDPAVILYTSGTTGYPKGVVLSQAALLRNGQLMAQRVGLAATIQLAVLPLYHAHALGFGLISALCTGGTLVFTDGLDVLQWARLVAAERIEVASVVPHMLPMLRQAGLRAERVPTLRRLLVSSAPLSLEVARAFEDTTGVSLLQGWGLSEVTNFATCLPGDLPEDERRALLFGGLAGPWTCAGAPLAGVTVEVRGADGARLGEADEGELWIRSPCRMVGYHGDPAATAELCRDEWLGSGDLGFWIARGDRQYFFITGRQKELIVRGADKYAPLAIERKLLAHAAAARGRLAVLGMKHRLYGEEVAAYLHVDPDSDLVPALRDAIAMLPLAERPKVLVCGDAPIPQTHTGKVQRRRLVELFHAYSDHRGALKIEAQRGVAELLTTASKSANPTVQQGDSSE